MDGTINSLACCADLIDSYLAEYNNSPNNTSVFIYDCGGESFPYGIWFRGEPNSDDSVLTPSIFRPKEKGKNIYYDETAMFNYAVHRFQELSNNKSNIFSVLCTMQHYRLPTRLLDWTENLLIGVYFAVRDGQNKKDASLYVLNARKLNKLTGMASSWKNIHDEDDFGTQFRCVFVNSKTKDDWFSRVKSIKEFDWQHPKLPQKYKDSVETYKNTSIPIIAIQDHCTPVAVLPTLSNPRMAQQRSVFTLHGGKVCSDNLPIHEQIPAPRTLLELNAGISDKFLKCYRIPANNKERIREQLMAFGIHEGIIFPELENELEIIKRRF